MPLQNDLGKIDKKLCHTWQIFTVKEVRALSESVKKEKVVMKIFLQRCNVDWNSKTKVMTKLFTYVPKDVC